MKNKTGKTNMWLVLVIIAAALLIFGVIKLPNFGGTTPETPTGGNCEITPSLSAVGVDALVANQNVTVGTYYYIVNGQYVGTSYSPIKGDSITVLNDPSGYLADKKTVSSVICDKNPVNFAFRNYANATITIKQDPVNGASALTDNVAGGAVNATSIAAGATANLPIIVQGVNQKSTGNIFAVFEMPTGSASNVSSIGLTCDGQTLSPASIPSAVSSTNTNAYRAAFVIPRIDNAATKTCNLQINTLATKTLAGGVYTTYYGMEQFIDTDGQAKEGIYDANGNAKYQDTYDYDFLFA